MALTRDQILQAPDLANSIEKIDVPEWGGEVCVKGMTGAERDRFEASYQKNPGVNTRARLAVYTICDEQGHPVFTEADIPLLGGKSSAALDRIFEKMLKASALSKQDIDDLEGNSGATP